MIESRRMVRSSAFENAYLRVRRAITASLIHAPRRRQLGISFDRAPLFRTVFFELRTRCNSRCSFCAAAVQFEKRPDAIMPFDLYAKVIDDLAGIGYEGAIAYHVNNDPLVVPGLEGFVGHARAHLPRCWLRIYTNGLALSRAKGEALLRAGIDELTVNWYAPDSRSTLPRHLLDFRDLVLPQFHPRERVRSGTGPLHPGDRSIFRFNIHRRLIGEVLDSRAGSAPNKEAWPEDATGFCEHPFTQLNITVDGRVGRCCADFYFADVMGNVATQNVLDIWYGKPFEKARLHLLQGDRSASVLCSRCDFSGVPLEGTPPVTRVAGSLLYRLDRLLRGFSPLPPGEPELSAQDGRRQSATR